MTRGRLSELSDQSEEAKYYFDLNGIGLRNEHRKCFVTSMPYDTHVYGNGGKLTAKQQKTQSM